MSHLTKQKSTVPFTDLDTLAAAIKRLGGTLDKSQKIAHYYNGRTATCDAAIKFPDTAYEIAVHKNAKGEYELEADLYCSTLRKHVCHDMTSRYDEVQTEKISEFYRIEELDQEARLSGFQIADPIYDQAAQQYVLEYERFVS